MTNRTVTLPTSDHGDVTLPEPDWCIGHPYHQPDDLRADILHVGPRIECTQLGRTLLTARIAQSPFAPPGDPRLGGRTPGVSVGPLGLTLDPTDLYCLAVALDSYADRLRDLADELTALIGGGS